MIIITLHVYTRIVCTCITGNTRLNSTHTWKHIHNFAFFNCCCLCVCVRGGGGGGVFKPFSIHFRRGLLEIQKKEKKLF